MTVGAFAITLVSSALIVLASGQERPVSNVVADGVDVWNVRQFVTALAAARIPTGVILLSSDAEGLPVFPAPHGIDLAAHLDSLIASFEARHPEYRVHRTASGGVFVAPAGSGWCSAPATTRRRSLKTMGKAHEVAHQIFRTWADAKDPYVPPGLVGTSDSEPSLYLTYVTLALQDATLVSALNALGDQVPGLGWAIQEVRHGDGEAARQRSRFGCNLTLFHGRGWLTTTDTFLVR